VRPDFVSPGRNGFGVLHGACSRAVCDKFGVRDATSTNLTPPASFLALPINRRVFLHRYRRPSSGSLFAMPQVPVDLLNEKLASVATDIEAIEKMIASETLQTTDQLLALRTVQELYRRLADDLRVAISLFE